jgi:hypothetical protein
MESESHRYDSDVPGAPIRAGESSPLRVATGGDANWSSKSRRRRSPASTNRRRDRRKQHSGVCRSTRAVNELSLARVRWNTKHSASTQGTGREPKANQPGRTKVVVATHRGGGKAKPGMTSGRGKDRIDFERTNCLNATRTDCGVCPAHEPEALGVSEPMPRSYLSQLLHPFRRRRG